MGTGRDPWIPSWLHGGRFGSPTQSGPLAAVARLCSARRHSGWGWAAGRLLLLRHPGHRRPPGKGSDGVVSLPSHVVLGEQSALLSVLQ